MRVLVLAHFFPPETGAASHRIAAVSAALQRAGHDVTVVTTLPSWPTGIRAAEYRGQAAVRESRDGADVRRVWSFASPRFTKRNRLLGMLTSAFGSAAYVLLARPRYDVVYVSSPPITLALPALLASMLRRAPLVADIRDVYPEVAIRLGEWKAGSRITRVVGRVAEMLYARAAAIVTVTHACREEILARGVDPAKVTVVPNGFDAVVPSPVPPYEKAAGEFTVSYTGNMGLAIGVGVLIDTAKLLAGDPRFRFVLVGDGAQRDEIAARILNEKIGNVVMLGALSRADTFAVQVLSDVCAVTLRRNLIDSLPTKLIDALALGRPVIVSARGEAKRFVEEARGGVAVEPEDPAALASALQALANDPAALREFGANGKAFVEGRFERSVLAAQICREIEGVAQRANARGEAHGAQEA
jgi:glycosyltransferase involved in cell wall biosynthesis